MGTCGEVENVLVCKKYIQNIWSDKVSCYLMKVFACDKEERRELSEEIKSFAFPLSGRC